MKSPIPRIILGIFFVGLLATPLIIKRINARNKAASENIDTSTAMSRYGFHLEESAKAAGIDFKHTAPTLDPKLDHIMIQVASMGAAVSIADFDRDGWQDVYVCNSGEGSRNALYRNNG
ncbi:MAG TPA: VCBS repeat-containing protein, partial [Blastocatellia bacterium]|nr:VCBS repeat-containing protein [Blastocatellia bacterium]